MLGLQAPMTKEDSNPARAVTTSRTGPREEAIYGATMAMGVPSRLTGIAKAALCVGRDGKGAVRGECIQENKIKDG